MAQPGTLTTACCLSVASREENQVVETRIVGGGGSSKVWKKSATHYTIYHSGTQVYIYSIYLYSKTLKKS